MLRRAVREGRIAQGMILAGPDGVGKRRFALALAQALNCEQPLDGDACGQCLQCRKIEAGEHPDVTVVSPDGQFIKTAQMREMSRETSFRPYEGRRQVKVIDDADRLHPQAANSILKTLEEPPETSVIVLVTSKPYALLETIRSRCQMVSFAPLTYEELESHLRGMKRNTEESRLLARIAEGSIGRALSLDVDEFLEARRVMLGLLDVIVVGRDPTRLINAADYLGKKLDRDTFIRHIDVLLMLFEDLFRLKLGEGTPALINADVGDRLERLASRIGVQRVMAWASQLEEIKQRLPRNINRQLAMEAMLLSAVGA
jgi:DNA polymerase III subunit delta'